MTNTIKPSPGNPIKILNSSLEGLTITDDGDAQVKLGDNSGTQKLSIRDSDGAEVAYIDSNGVVSGASGALPTAVEGSILVGTSTPDWGAVSAKTNGAVLVGNGTTVTSTTNPSIAGNVTIGGTLTVNTNDLVVNGTGVGIGTTPVEKLHVDGGIVTTGAASLGAGAGLYSGCSAGSSSITSLNPGVAWLPLVYQALSHEWFYSGTVGMKLSTSGNVLIGSATDNGDRLQVTSDGTNAGLTVDEANPTLGVVASFGGAIEVTDGSGGRLTYIDSSGSIVPVREIGLGGSKLGVVTGTSTKIATIYSTGNTSYAFLVTIGAVGTYLQSATYLVNSTYSTVTTTLLGKAVMPSSGDITMTTSFVTGTVSLEFYVTHTMGSNATCTIKVLPLLAYEELIFSMV